MTAEVCDTRYDFESVAAARLAAIGANAEDMAYMAYRERVDHARARIRHLPDWVACEMVREMVQRVGYDPYVILLALEPEQLLWLLDAFPDFPVKPPGAA